MSNILLVSERNPIKRGKDCPDWCPLTDGTKSGDPIYCDLSLICRQMDDTSHGYLAHWYKFRDMETGEEKFDYFCTGIYPESYEEIRGVDEEVS